MRVRVHVSPVIWAIYRRPFQGRAGPARGGKSQERAVGDGHGKAKFSCRFDCFVRGLGSRVDGGWFAIECLRAGLHSC